MLGAFTDIKDGDVVDGGTVGVWAWVFTINWFIFMAIKSYLQIYFTWFVLSLENSWGINFFLL